MKLEKWVRWLRVSTVILVTTTILTVWMAYASAQIAHQELDPGLDSDPFTER
ncbi:MAG: hypothetical protein JSV15_05840 [Candidatus Bathyarchaeota archaeon]|nr:MAG: hypothetical protein JSV15_05840 [Candidatus Bathyarchaeota archaeon]